MKKADNFNPGKWLVENKLTNQSRLNEAKQVVMINGKQVDLGSLELDGVDPSDYPDFSDAYVVSAKFTDGTDLDSDEIDEFNDDYYDIAQEMAGESLINENESTSVPEDIKTFVLDWGIGPVYDDIDEDDWNEGEEMETTIDLDFFDYDDEKEEYEMCKKIIDFIKKRKGKVTFYDEEFKDITLSLNGNDIIVNWIQIPNTY
jgi:hypothetical protein